jgi:hypothetical protein
LPLENGKRRRGGSVPCATAGLLSRYVPAGKDFQGDLIEARFGCHVDLRVFKEALHALPRR